MRVKNARMLAVLALGLSGEPVGAGPEATDMHLEDAPENQMIRDMDPGISDLINDGNILDLRFE
jgi:hypothetical protein